MFRVFIYFLIAFFLIISSVTAQELPVPKSVGEEHPRSFGKNMSLKNVTKLVQNEEWAANIVKNTKHRLKPYLNYYKKDNKWLVSRLQMYWKSKSNQIYINGI